MKEMGLIARWTTKKNVFFKLYQIDLIIHYFVHILYGSLTGGHSLALKSIVLLSITFIWGPFLLLPMLSVPPYVHSFLSLVDYSWNLWQKTVICLPLLVLSLSLLQRAGPLWCFLSVVVFRLYYQNQFLLHFPLYSQCLAQRSVCHFPRYFQCLAQTSAPASYGMTACGWSVGACCGVIGCNTEYACDATG